MTATFLSTIIALIIMLQQEIIYDFEVQPISGASAVSLSTFAGKKIIVTIISPLNPDTTTLAFLDSLQQSDTELQIIAVPAADLGAVGHDQDIAVLTNALSPGFIIIKSAMVSKSAGTGQMPLFKWLTNVSQNRHFDIDANAYGQYFIVSKAGTLYSVLPANVPADILTRTLSEVITP
jgi:glutathione peroxidase-family protein